MPPTPPADDLLTTQARAGLRRIHWPALLAGAGGAATLGLLGAAGLAPLLASLGVGTLATGPVVAWLTGMGMNALAGWMVNFSSIRWSTFHHLTKTLVIGLILFPLFRLMTLAQKRLLPLQRVEALLRQREQ
ncbi:MAG: hypothetical protein EOM24_29935 [Chloroflexia bacterium]|nr:hypothetical protein [Chloroflexia bacterium]